MTRFISPDLTTTVKTPNLTVGSDDPALNVVRHRSRERGVHSGQRAIVIFRVQRNKERIVSDFDGSWLVTKNSKQLVRPSCGSAVNIPIPAPETGERLCFGEMAPLSL
jgi:hypothetical protein